MPPDAGVATAEPKRRGALIPTLIVLGVLGVLFLLFVGFYSEWLWFDSVGFTSVFTRTLLVRIALFVLFGLLFGGLVGLNVWLAYRNRPAFRGMSPEQAGLERYRVSLEPLRKPLLVGIVVFLGLLAGGSAAAEWRTFLLWRNSSEFGRTDAQFNVDVSFYAFELPFWRFLVGFGFGIVIVSLIASAVTHYLYGGIKLQGPGERITPFATAHLSILLAAFVLLKAAAYWLDRYGLVVKDGNLFTGAGFTDVNAILPAKNILVFVALACAVLFVVTAFRRQWRLALLGLGLLIVSAVAVGGIYPAIVQQFQVRPAEPSREQDFIERNITATREAYGLDKVEVTSYDAKETPTEESLTAALGTIENIRLLDPTLVSPTFNQLQQIRGFYAFPDALDVDRYQIEGDVRDSVIAVRELTLDGLQDSQRNWANDHLVYTHGFGFVGAFGNEVQSTGAPTFFESDIPPEGSLDIEQPRIYFGERTTQYSIVASQQPELDFPDDASPNGQANTSYDGDGGVNVGSFLNRIVFATKFQEGNILLSRLIDADSKILWDRTPRERVEKVAPWLQTDGDPYPVVVDGRVKWIVDAYTTSNQYPYSERTALTEATSDSVTATRAAVVEQQSQRANYIRNSVKAVVDAFEGDVVLYEWDTEDPVLQTWEKAFPGTVTARQDIPAELLAQMRYPEDVFKVQRNIFSRYHVTDPQAFYGGQDFWKLPDDPTRRTAGQPQPPYYLTLQMPGTSSESFSLTTAFTPNRRETLAAFMAVNADPGEDYGTIRVLQLPRSTTIPGPSQVQNNFESDPTVASELTLLRRGGSDVELGNLLSLPVAGGLLYVEPVYVRATSGASFPLLRKVLTSYGNRVAFEDTLQESLETLFTGGGSTVAPPTDPEAPVDPEAPPPSAADPLTQALQDAEQALADAEAALAAGDFAAYGEAQDRLADAIARAAAAAGVAEEPPVVEPSPEEPVA